MTSLADRVDEFLRAPVTAALFVLADRNGLDADDLADPTVACQLATLAVRSMSPWSTTDPAASVRTRALALVRRLDDLVEAVITDPRNAWWDGPLDRSSQLMLGDETDDPMVVTVPTGPATDWEIYGQKPETNVWTSSQLSADPVWSTAHAEMDCGTSDWAPTFPLRQVRLEVSADARVYEVHSPEDWRALTEQYGDLTRTGLDSNLWDCAGIEHGPAPTWSAVAKDWDAVHLSLAGLLTGLYVPEVVDSITTTLWAWDWESTRWLRSVFVGATPLPDLREPPRTPERIVHF